jgi:hypothetical protein
MNFFNSTPVDVTPQNKIKEGFLKKESRYRKVWRQRWCVLTNANFYTFETKQHYTNPTEALVIKDIKTVKTDETKQGFYFVKFF